MANLDFDRYPPHYRTGRTGSIFWNWLRIQATRLWASLGDIIRDMAVLFRQSGFQFTDEEIGGFGSVHLSIATKEDH